MRAQPPEENVSGVHHEGHRRPLRNHHHPPCSFPAADLICLVEFQLLMLSNLVDNPEDNLESIPPSTPETSGFVRALTCLTKWAISSNRASCPAKDSTAMFCFGIRWPVVHRESWIVIIFLLQNHIYIRSGLKNSHLPHVCQGILDTVIFAVAPFSKISGHWQCQS